MDSDPPLLPSAPPFPAPPPLRGRLRFIPSSLPDVPPSALAELRQVFDDIDEARAGRVPADEVLLALDVNSLDVAQVDLELAVAEMVRLSAAAGAPDGAVARDAFCRCLHALSLQQRDVLPAALYAVFPDSDFTSIAGATPLQLRRAVWLALEDPLSSPAAGAVSTVVVAAILLSTVAFCVETLPGVHMRHTAYFYGIEAGCVALFTVEFLLRALCTPQPRAFFRSALNWVDLAAIVPFYVELGLSASGRDSSLGSSAILRAMRLVRVFRMLKVGRYLALMRVFMRTLALSLAPLFMVAYVITIAALMCSSVAFFAEPPAVNGAAQGRSHYQEEALSPEAEATRLAGYSSIPALFWWCIVTMTGVGYGDVFPLSWPGRVAAFFTFFAGIVLTSVPISVISGNFRGEYNQMKRLKAIKAAHAGQPEKGGGPAPTDADPDPPESAREQRERLLAAQAHVRAAWSEPFLLSALQVTRNSRRALMAKLKMAELTSRERAGEDLERLVSDVGAEDATATVLRRASKTGLA